jgi:hypothetical protein
LPRSSARALLSDISFSKPFKTIRLSSNLTNLKAMQ